MASAPLEALTSPAGALALAVAALLVVLGRRLAPPRGTAGRLAFGAYAASLAATLLGGLRLLPGPAPAASLGLRLAGAALLVAGLLVAGSPARRARAAAQAGAAPPPTPPAAHAGLTLVLLGQLLRAPSAAGAAGVAVAALAHGWAAWTAQRTRAGV